MHAILKKLDEERIVSFTISIDKQKVIAVEKCDQYFEMELSKHELIQLAQELLDLAEQIKE
jgi:hypothetical protein